MIGSDWTLTFTISSSTLPLRHQDDTSKLPECPRPRRLESMRPHRGGRKSRSHSRKSSSAKDVAWRIVHCFRLFAEDSTSFCFSFSAFMISPPRLRSRAVQFKEAFQEFAPDF